MREIQYGRTQPCSKLNPLIKSLKLITYISSIDLSNLEATAGHPDSTSKDPNCNYATHENKTSGHSDSLYAAKGLLFIVPTSLLRLQ
jgi:hypothetical protein